MKYLGPVVVALLLCAMPAYAQTANVVSSCGGITYPANLNFPVTQDTTGRLCGSGTGGAATLADGADVTQGAKADAKSTATDTTPITMMQVLKEISAMVQAPPSQAATQSGTWTVQPGNTANTTPWLVTIVPTTTGGLSTYSGNVTTAGSGAGVGGVAVDASAGQLYGYQIWNGNSSVCYIQIFDQTQALTNLGTTVPKKSIGIPALGGANLSIGQGIPFATAITIGATTTRNGSTACSTGLDINIDYK